MGIIIEIAILFIFAKIVRKLRKYFKFIDYICYFYIIGSSITVWIEDGFWSALFSFLIVSLGMQFMFGIFSEPENHSTTIDKSYYDLYSDYDSGSGGSSGGSYSGSSGGSYSDSYNKNYNNDYYSNTRSRYNHDYLISEYEEYKYQADLEYKEYKNYVSQADTDNSFGDYYMDRKELFDDDSYLSLARECYDSAKDNMYTANKHYNKYKYYNDLAEKAKEKAR